jgi:hypothetical protein
MIIFKGINVKVPEPAVFVLMKFLLTIKRKDEIKIQKDLRTATELAEFLLSKPLQKISLQTTYSEMPKKWQKKLNPIIENNCPKLYSLLNEL